MINVFIKQRFELYIEKRCNTSKSNPKHDINQAKVVLDNKKKYHQLRKRLLKRVFIYSVVIRYFKLYQQGQTIILKWVEKYHKFRREYKHLSSDVSVSYLWSEAEVMQLSAGGADWTAPAL